VRALPAGAHSPQRVSGVPRLRPLAARPGRGAASCALAPALGTGCGRRERERRGGGGGNGSGRSRGGGRSCGSGRSCGGGRACGGRCAGGSRCARGGRRARRPCNRRWRPIRFKRRGRERRRRGLAACWGSSRGEARGRMPACAGRRSRLRRPHRSPRPRAWAGPSARRRSRRRGGCLGTPLRNARRVAGGGAARDRRARDAAHEHPLRSHVECPELRAESQPRVRARAGARSERPGIALRQRTGAHGENRVRGRRTARGSGALSRTVIPGQSAVVRRAAGWDARRAAGWVARRPARVRAWIVSPISPAETPWPAGPGRAGCRAGAASRWRPRGAGPGARRRCPRSPGSRGAGAGRA
jgi:hypothetical protein